MKGRFFYSFTKAYSMRELNSPMTTYECEQGYHRDPNEYGKNAANKVENLVVKQPFENGEG